MMQTRILEQAIETPTRYFYPLTTTLLTATTEGAAQTIGTVRAESLGLVERFFVANQTGSATSLTVNFIPDGGTIGAANREIPALSIPGNTNVDLSDFIAGLYAPGTVVRAYASAGSALIIGGYVRGLI